MSHQRVGFRLPTFAAYVSEHPLLSQRGVNGEEVLYVFAAVGQYLRTHPEHVALFTQALLSRAGMTTRAQQGGA